MPTENRSSNTETAVKLQPCPYCGQLDAFVEQLDSDASVVICQGRVGEHSACLARGPVGVQQHDCESQPGHDQAVKEWNKRAAQPHPEPIAWMVGTAFWWTKEEAERDAAATGKPMTPFGPMTGAYTPAEQHQGKPVAVLYANGTVLTKADCGNVFDICCKVETPLYTHADPGEVECLRVELGHMREERDDLSAKLDRFYSRTHGIKNLAAIEDLSDKLAERDALLEEVWAYDIGTPMKRKIKAALSASAEPEPAP